MMSLNHLKYTIHLHSFLYSPIVIVRFDFATIIHPLLGQIRLCSTQWMGTIDIVMNLQFCKLNGLYDDLFNNIIVQPMDIYFSSFYDVSDLLSTLVITILPFFS